MRYFFNLLFTSVTCHPSLLSSHTKSVFCVQRLIIRAAQSFALGTAHAHILRRWISSFPMIFICFFFSTSKPGEELDWDEEFALQDFLKSELEERNCREQRGGQTDGNHREVADKSAGGLGEEKGVDGSGGRNEERWMVVDTEGEAEGEARATSTPVAGLPAAAQPSGGHGEYDITATVQFNDTFPGQFCLLH